jgi:hypothetical protein
MSTSAIPQSEVPEFDFRPLATRYSRDQLRQFKKSRRVWWTRRAQVAAVVGSSFLILGFAFVEALLLATLWLTVSTPAIIELGTLGTLASGALLGLLVFVTYLGARSLRRDISFGPGWQRIARLNSFAQRNGMLYRPYVRGLRHAGSIFDSRGHGFASDVMVVTAGRKIQIGNYRNFGATALDRSRSDWGYLLIELDRSMPHMMAIARANRGMNRQSIALGLLRSQVLSLEGDFDKYFTLYSPKEYELDALYVFTPDLMALMIDRLASFDVEIVDNWFCLYAHKPFDLMDPATHQRLANIVQVVGRKATNQTLRYSDDRTAPDVDRVAPGGLRLRRGITLSAVIAVLYVAVRLFTSLHGL